VQALLVWQDDRDGDEDIYGGLVALTDTLQTTVITYDYDPLGRLVEASYSGIFSGTYSYDYDALGNRLRYTTNITTSETMTHTYDVTNRLQQSVDQDGLITTYEWDAMSRLITTTVASQVSRVYQYSQDGKLLSAEVDGLLTTFAYDGDGNRLLMSVAGEVTTYTLDYANKGQILLEQGGAFAQTKHYLYGLECIGELVDADEPETEEWRYYQQDGNNLLRQTTNSQAEITLAWAYSPDGAVLFGEKGPVTNLGCGSGAVYDWSTGLVFKNGRYFDPTLGMWLTLIPMMIWQFWVRKRRHKSQWFLALVFFISIMFSLASCIPSDPCYIPAPNRNPYAENPAFDNEIKNSTVIVQYFQHIEETSGSESSITISRAKGLGTVTDGGRTIITHNHFTPDIVQGATGFEIIDPSSGEVLESISRVDFPHRIIPFNSETLRVQTVESLHGIKQPIQTGDLQDLLVGDSIASAYYDEGKSTVEIHHSPLKKIGMTSESSTCMGFLERSHLIKPGDSGGGRFANGRLIGSHYGSLTVAEGDFAAFALLKSGR
jgi:YD repeat-containing protein